VEASPYPRLDLRSTHHPAAGAKRGGRCFRAILRRAAEWRRRSESSPQSPAALRAVAPVLAAQAFGLALSLGDGAGRRSAQSQWESTKPRYVFALYESLVLCWTRTIDNRLRLLLQQTSEIRATVQANRAWRGESGEDRPQQVQHRWLLGGWLSSWPEGRQPEAWLVLPL